GARRSASVCDPSCESLNKSSTGACMIPFLKPVDGSSRSCRVTSTTTRYQGTLRAWPYSGTDCWACGGGPFAVAVNSTDSRGLACSRWADDGFLNRMCFILIPQFASSPHI